MWGVLELVDLGGLGRQLPAECWGGQQQRVVIARAPAPRTGWRRIRQIGPPGEIWRRPADAWVAGVIGIGDLISGNVADAYVRTALGDVAPKGGSHSRTGPRSCSWHCRGVVVDRHFSGSEHLYCVELEDGGRVHSRQPASVEIITALPSVTAATGEARRRGCDEQTVASVALAR